MVVLTNFIGIDVGRCGGDISPVGMVSGVDYLVPHPIW